MFSDIRDILPIKPPASDAQAQQSDTRQEILRHDPEQERQKKKKNNKDDQGGLFGDDLTEVSVDTLEVFLQQILDNYTGKDNEDETERDEESVDLSQQEPSPLTNPNTKAIGAYARTATYTNHEAVHPSHTQTPPSSGPQLSSADMQLVYQMEKDLALLKEKSVRGISIIENAGDESFLQSIHRGIKRALL